MEIGVLTALEDQMGLFGKLVATAVNVAALPIVLAKDVCTLGGVATQRRDSYTAEKLKEIKADAKNSL